MRRVFDADAVGAVDRSDGLHHRGKAASHRQLADVSGPAQTSVDHRDSHQAGKVLSLVMARDHLLDLDATEQPARVMDTYVADGQVMVQLWENQEVVSRPLCEVLSTAADTGRLLDPLCRPDPDAEVLYWLEPPVRRKAFELQAHLLDVLYGRPDSATTKDLDPFDAETTTVTSRKQAKMRELNWNASKMSRQLARYAERGIVGLIPHAGRKARLQAVIDVPPEILALVREHVQGRELGSKKDLQSEYAVVISDLRRRGLVTCGDGVPSPDGGTLPSLNTVLPYHRFSALVRHLDGGRGRKHAKTAHEQLKRPLDGPLRHRGFDFGDEIEMDATRTDILVQDENGDACQVHAVFAVCVSTRMMWLRLVHEPPRGRDLALLLFDMLGGCLGPDTKAHQGVSTVPSHLSVHAFPPNAGPTPRVLPGAIRLDHGAEEENEFWISFCAQLRITLHWTVTMTPTGKAFIESMIRTFARDCQLLPGHKGNNVLNRPANLKNKDLPTFEQVRRAFQVWPQWAANQPHTGLQRGTSNRYYTPAQAVSMSLRRGTPIRVLADPTLPLRLLPTKMLTPQDDGVVWENRRYWCDDYGDVLAASRRKGEKRRLVFYYDPEAKHRLYWIEPGSFRVRRLSSAGDASGIQPAFGDVRSMIASMLEESAQPWPTHTEIGQRRADLLDLMRRSWNEDGIDPNRNAAPTPRRSRKRSRKAATGPADVTNDGWRLEDFGYGDAVGESTDPADETRDRRTEPRSGEGDWESWMESNLADGDDL